MPLLLRFVCELNINAMSDATCPSLTERNTTCPKCQYSLTKTDLKELRGLGKLIHIVESGSLVRCPSCGHLFPINKRDFQDELATDMPYLIGAILVALGFGYFIAYLLGFDLPLIHS